MYVRFPVPSQKALHVRFPVRFLFRVILSLKGQPLNTNNEANSSTQLRIFLSNRKRKIIYVSSKLRSNYIYYKLNYNKLLYFTLFYKFQVSKYYKLKVYTGLRGIERECELACENWRSIP